MKITKLEHSGVVLEKDGRRLVFDPVEFEETLLNLEEVAAIIITHKHGDHLQKAQIEKILAQNPTAKLFAVGDAGDELPKAELLADDEVLEIGGFSLRMFGHDHAEIVDGEVPCQNIGVVVDEMLVNPGDSFDLPEMDRQIEVLLVPSAAPWCKVSEGMEYIKLAKPKMVIPVHNAVLSELGNSFNNNWLKRACDEVGAELKALAVGESLEIEQEP